MNGPRLAPRLACWLLLALLAACAGPTATTTPAPPPAITPGASAAAPSAPASAPAAPTAAPAAPVVAAPPAVGGKPITIAWTAAASDYGPLWIATDKGFFTKYGVNVQLQFIDVAASFQALVAGDIDVLATASDPSLRAQGVDVKYFGSPIHYLAFGLYGRPGLDPTPAGLIGKTVAATNSGSATDVFAREVLARIGVDPAGMQYLYTQNIPAIYAGVDAGAFDVGPLPAPFAFTAETNPTITKVATLGAVRVPFMTAAPLARTDWIRAHEAEAQGIMQGYKDAIAFAQANEQETIAILGKYLKLDDQQVLRQSYQLAMQFWGVPDLYVDRDALKLAIEYGARANPSVQGLTVEEFVYEDNKIAKALR